jgi:hypothetical protein
MAVPDSASCIAVAPAEIQTQVGRQKSNKIDNGSRGCSGVAGFKLRWAVKKISPHTVPKFKAAAVTLARNLPQVRCSRRRMELKPHLPKLALLQASVWG